MKDMNWPERVAYLENQLADSDRDNKRLRGQVDEAVECCIIKDNRNLRLEAELTALKRAAWDAHDTVSAMLDNNEAEDSKAIRKVLDELGELLPAKRPVSNSRTVHGGSPMTLREVMEAEERTPDAPTFSYPTWTCVHCKWVNTLDSDCFACKRPRDTEAK